MPILPILYAVSLALCFGGGVFYEWQDSYNEIVRLQNEIEQTHQDSEKLKNDANAFALLKKEQQQNTIIELEERYYDQIKANDNLHDQLVTVQRMYRASNKTSGCNRVSKANNTSRSKENVSRESKLETNRVSEELDSYLQSNAVNIDRLDQDKHYLLNWINSIPKELIDETTTNNKIP